MRLRQKYALTGRRCVQTALPIRSNRGPFAGFADDPWSDPHFTRDPLSDEVDVAVIGAGFGDCLQGPVAELACRASA